jgi:hypothetical protein
MASKAITAKTTGFFNASETRQIARYIKLTRIDLNRTWKIKFHRV